MLNSIAIDMHTHSLYSGHAYSTFEEMADYVRNTGLKGFCLTDHSPRGGAMDAYIPLTFREMPRDFEGIRVYYGMEVDILDYNGNLNIIHPLEQLLDFGIFGFHDNQIEPGHSITECTQAVLAVFENPSFDLLAHPCRRGYPLDTSSIVDAARKYNKLIELNENCLIRLGTDRGWYVEILEECRRKNVRIAVNSDAHFSRNIGRVCNSIKLLNEISFPEELVINTTVEKVEKYMEERERRFVGGRYNVDFSWETERKEKMNL